MFLFRVLVVALLVLFGIMAFATLDAISNGDWPLAVIYGALLLGALATLTLIEMECSARYDDEDD